MRKEQEETGAGAEKKKRTKWSLGAKKSRETTERRKLLDSGVDKREGERVRGIGRRRKELGCALQRYHLACSEQKRKSNKKKETVWLPGTTD